MWSIYEQTPFTILLQPSPKFWYVLNAKMELTCLCLMCSALLPCKDDREAAPRGTEKDGAVLWRQNYRGLRWEMIEDIKCRRGKAEKQALAMKDSKVVLLNAYLFESSTRTSYFLFPLLSQILLHLQAKQRRKKKKNGRKPPHSKMFSTVWHGCYPGSLTPAEVAACFSLILAKTFFTGHEDWMVLISTAEDSHRKSVVMKKTWVKKQGLKFWRKNITVVTTLELVKRWDID